MKTMMTENHPINGLWNCKHSFEEDLIDIDPDRSQIIYRCKHCEYMTNRKSSPEHVSKRNTKTWKEFLCEIGRAHV